MGADINENRSQIELRAGYIHRSKFESRIVLLYIDIYVYIYININMYVYTYIYIYIHIHTFNII